MKITFVDSGVLVTAARGVGEDSEKALEILADSNREFASSEFIKLEVSLKAIYNRKMAEAEFYESFFSAVTYWTNDIDQVIQDAYEIGCQYGLAAMDALHISAALQHFPLLCNTVYSPCSFPSIAFRFEYVPHSCGKCCISRC
jgi:predicted nucleic acid-binding protein